MLDPLWLEEANLTARILKTERKALVRTEDEQQNRSVGMMEIFRPLWET